MAGQLMPGSPSIRPTVTYSTSPAATATAATPSELAADRSAIPLSRPQPYPTRQNTRACSPSSVTGGRRDVQREPGPEPGQHAGQWARRSGPSATTTSSTRSGSPPGNGSRSTTVSCSSSATTMSRPQGCPPHLRHPPPAAIGCLICATRRAGAGRQPRLPHLSRPLPRGAPASDGEGCGVTVTVTVGVASGPPAARRTSDCAAAARPRCRPRRARRSPRTAGPARVRSALPALLCTSLITPTGTPGTYGRSLHRRGGDQLLARPAARRRRRAPAA